MELCVVSGKGGTGKTTVSVGLAVALGSLAGESAELLDCDVEAPNAHLYFGCSAVREEAVTVPVPAWDPARCTACGACVKACRFSALALFGQHLEVFEEHCHGCGACLYVCPADALSETERQIGVLRTAQTPGVDLRWGLLNVGEPRAAPVIEALRSRAETRGYRVVDGPPGTSCSLVAAAKGAGAALIVTEPTPFGLHDLELAWRTLTLLRVPSAVVVNKSQGRNRAIHSFCRSRGLPILLEIPFDRGLARTGAQGIPLPVADPAYQAVLRRLWANCEGLSGCRRAA